MARMLLLMALLAATAHAARLGPSHEFGRQLNALDLEDISSTSVLPSIVPRLLQASQGMLNQDELAAALQSQSTMGDPATPGSYGSASSAATEPDGTAAAATDGDTSTTSSSTGSSGDEEPQTSSEGRSGTDTATEAAGGAEAAVGIDGSQGQQPADQGTDAAAATTGDSAIAGDADNANKIEEGSRTATLDSVASEAATSSSSGAGGGSNGALGALAAVAVVAGIVMYVKANGKRWLERRRYRRFEDI